LASSEPEYALGYSNAEHERLIRQGRRIAPYTERLFRSAGLAEGDRVLDLGSGVGDVSMLAARIVGPAGEVVGVERDPDSIARARRRVAEAEFRNVSFVQADLNGIPSDKPFDAAVGRFILMFLPEPVAVLRSVARAVRPGGVLAFQEPSWAPFLALGQNIPLWSKLLAIIHETFVRSGVHTEMGLDLYRIFPEAGLPKPAMNIEIPLGCDEEFTGLLSSLVQSIRPLAENCQVSLEPLGDTATLSDRIQSEVQAANCLVSFVPLVGVWARKPG
jgi:ubiquinone/menaquinone biosynthesis C-methylase UbiE